MIVADASSVVSALTRRGDARDLLGSEHVCVPHLVDSEIANALRGMSNRGELDTDTASRLLNTWARLGVERFSANGLLPRIWELHGSVSAYDATYVALAEELDCALVTADGRLARAPGPTCRITVVRS